MWSRALQTGPLRVLVLLDHGSPERRHQNGATRLSLPPAEGQWGTGSLLLVGEVGLVPAAPEHAESLPPPLPSQLMPLQL